ncbi:MAG TPA: methionyl-tRNA formyltransferase [Phycisphaerales bacterium]|nr:methionyl-tRNA formyltransferase [Phycisphaerales bacterium]
MRLVYFGSGAFGLPTLQALAAAHTVALVVTQPDRPAGRGGRLTPTPVGEWAEEHAPGVPVLKPERVNAPEVVEQIRGAAADAWVVIAFGQKLGRKLLEDRFAINLHASLLPRWRGAAPINAAILAGDRVTGNSVITLADRMDAGLVLGRSERPIEPSATAGELHDFLAADGPGLVLRVLAERGAGSLRGTSQDEALVTLAPKLSREGAWVDFAATADECRRRINGLSPWPGVLVSLGDLQLKLLRSQVEAGAGAGSAAPGTLIDPGAGLVACGAGVVRLLGVQPVGKRAMSWPEFARGRALPPGACLRGDRGGGPC